jgi:hypothetical protein
MGLSTNTYTYSGSSTFVVNFASGFIARADVQVRINNAVDGAGDPVYATFVWVDDNNITVTSTLTAGDSVEILRTVSKTALAVSFATGADITPANLDLSANQGLMVYQELLDGRVDGVESPVVAANRAETAALAAESSETDAAADLVLTNADVVLTNADVVLTNADVVSTNANATSTANDLVATNQDTLDTAADLVLTNADAALTNADATSTAADVLLTAADAVSTANDLIATAQDVIDSAAFALSASNDADAAAVSEANAAASASSLVVDAASVQTAGALMDSEITNLAAVKSFDPAAYATAAEGALAGTSVQPTGVQTLADKTLTAPVINVTSDAAGDLYYRTAAGLFERLPIGSTDDALKVVAGLPAWEAPAPSLSGWIPYDMVTAGDGATGVIYDFAVDGTYSALVSPPFANGFEYAFQLVGMRTQGTGATTAMALFLNGDNAYTVYTTIATLTWNASSGAGDVLFYIPLPRVVKRVHGIKPLVPNRVSPGLQANATVNENFDDIVDYVRFTQAGTIDRGKILMYKRREYITG